MWQPYRALKQFSSIFFLGAPVRPDRVSFFACARRALQAASRPRVRSRLLVGSTRRATWRSSIPVAKNAKKRSALLRNPNTEFCLCKSGLTHRGVNCETVPPRVPGPTCVLPRPSSPHLNCLARGVPALPSHGLLPRPPRRALRGDRPRRCDRILGGWSACTVDVSDAAGYVSACTARAHAGDLREISREGADPREISERFGVSRGISRDFTRTLRDRKRLEIEGDRVRFCRDGAKSLGEISTKRFLEFLRGIRKKR